MILLATTSQFGLAQTTFNYGPELGFSFSHFPTKDEHTNITDLITTKTNPLISPLIGFFGQLTIKKHFQFMAGLQYQMTGTRYYSHKDGRIPRDPNIPAFFYYTQDEWEQQTFHKLCLPMTVGCSFIMGKVQPSIFFGFSPNFILTGNYYSKLVIDATDNSEDYESENKYNPVDPDDAGIPVDKYTSQLLFGLSVSIGQHIRITLNYKFGQDISYAQYPPSGGEVWMTSMKNRDFGISVTYLLKPLTRMIETTYK